MKKTKVADWFSFYAPRFYCLSAITGVVVRIILLLSPLTVADFTFAEWLRIFGLGFVNDMAFATMALVPAFVVYTAMTDKKYSGAAAYIIEILLLALTVYVVFFNDITDEYGGVVPGMAKGLLIVLLVCFSIKLFIPAVREPWRRCVAVIVMLVYAICVVLNALCESVFWSEFGVRYNFIAVDYLVYTNEVIGNIMESYPILPMAAGVLLVAAGICWLMLRGKDLRKAGISGWKRYAVTLCILAAGVGISVKWLHWGYRNLGSENMFVTQLQENGCWDFLEAYSSNELDYSRFYRMMPEDEATAMQREMCGMDENGVRAVRDSIPAVRKNIVLITVESLSAGFLGTYGNGEGITPNLDSLVKKSLVFDNLFATGNRTVRGLEAVTLCIPPSSGESIVKRPDNGGLFSTGSVLRDLGYSTTYFYGGDSYFDNMGTFFGGNGYDVVDRKSYPKEDITFSNIWGTCDEDTYRVALRAMDAMHAEGKPFFAHIMTISNHRPYTYPEGRISYEGNPMSRAAAVKYTDYAIGSFLDEASKSGWFGNTVFVIVADHCASSAGKTSLPLDGYHIPALIYSPGFVEPQRVEKVCSQIDLMPTLFSLLHFSYDSKFYGQDILAPDYEERAFVATYQDLGYYADGILTVLSPVSKVSQFAVEKDGQGYKETLIEETDESHLRRAQSFYQTANMAYSASSSRSTIL